MEQNGIHFGAFRETFQAAKIENHSSATTKNQNINSLCRKIKLENKFKSFVSIYGYFKGFKGVLKGPKRDFKRV